MKRRNFFKIQRQKEHKRGKFNNPFFKARRLKRARRTKFIVATSLIIFIVTPIAVLASPLYVIKDVEVSGLTTIPTNEVESIVEAQLAKKQLGVFSQRNRLFFNTNQLTTTLHDTYQLSEVDVQVSRNAIKLDIEEKISEVVWVSGEDMLFLDLDGVVVRTLYDTERAQIHERLNLAPVEVDDNLDIVLPPTLPVIFDNSQEPVLPGTNPIAPALVQNVIDFDKGVRRLLIHPKTYGVESPGTPWLRVDTDMPYDLLFDGSSDADEQVDTLRSVLQDNEGLDIQEYIDLRFGNKVFVK